MMSPAGPSNIILLTTGWGPKHGGINAFNHDFAAGLAQVRQEASAARVFCAVLNPTNAEVAEARSSHNVTLVPIRREQEPDRLDPAWALEVLQVLKRDHEDVHIDWWVGHDL